ncbi:dehydrogenase/reductase SDR family member 13-like [Ciona intestinalis]
MVSFVVVYPAVIFVGILGYAWWGNKYKRSICKSKSSLKGKTALITGGNSGIGKATAIEFAKRDARVIIACRNKAKAEAAVFDIRKESGNHEVLYRIVDFMDFSSVKLFAENFCKDEPYLDILVHNAAVFGIGEKYGYSAMVVTNVFGPFIMMHYLMRKMLQQAETRPVRIVVVGSDAYMFETFTKDKLRQIPDKTASSKTVFKMYGLSKLCGLFHFLALTKKLQGKNISTFCVHPGTVSTGLGGGFSHETSYGPWLRSMFMGLFATAPYFGCQTAVECAVAEGMEHRSGKYWSYFKEQELKPHALDQDLEEELWEECEKITECKWEFT